MTSKRENNWRFKKENYVSDNCQMPRIRVWYSLRLSSESDVQTHCIQRISQPLWLPYVA